MSAPRCGPARWPTIWRWTRGRAPSTSAGGGSHYRRIVERRRDLCRSRSPKAAPRRRAAGRSAPRRIRSTAAGASAARRSSPRSSGHADYYGVLCTETDRMRSRRAATRCISRSRRRPRACTWWATGTRWACAATVSRTLLFNDVFVPQDAALMPRGVYFQAASRWPHMFLTLSPSYMGLAQAAYDFTVRYLRGEVPGTPPVKRADVSDEADRRRRDAHQAGADQGAVVPGGDGGPRQSVEGAGAARLCRAIHDDGDRERSRRAWRSAPAAGRRCCGRCRWSASIATAAAGR